MISLMEKFALTINSVISLTKGLIFKVGVSIFGDKLRNGLDNHIDAYA